jgi:hypothetical protein
MTFRGRLTLKKQVEVDALRFVETVMILDLMNAMMEI